MPFVIEDSKTAISKKPYYWTGKKFTLNRDEAAIFSSFAAAGNTARKLRNKGLKPKIVEV